MEKIIKARIVDLLITIEGYKMSIVGLEDMLNGEIRGHITKLIDKLILTTKTDIKLYEDILTKDYPQLGGGTAKKCIITRYDETIKEPPFLTIKIDECEVIEPDNFDDGGIDFSITLKNACFNKGYILKFYSTSDKEGVDYELVVEPEN